MSRFFLRIVAVAAVLLLMACSGVQLNTPTIPPTALPAPTQAAIAPTVAPTVAPTKTDAPTLAPTNTATLAPTATATEEPTTAPSATVVASDENCIACHTSQSQLEELAVNTTVKSEETSGEG
jgi:mono/diheme cytochrome c family protein